MSVLDSKTVRETLNRLIIDKSDKGVLALKDYVESLNGFIPEPSDKGSGPPSDWDPVRFSCLIDNHKALEILIENKYPLSIKDTQGWSGILWCLSNDLLVSKLYDNDADLDVISNDTRTVHITLRGTLTEEDLKHHPIIVEKHHLNGCYSIHVP